jgi:hypothetical protein
VDDLCVEDDAADLLTPEKIMRRLASEALEAALGIGHRTRHPERGDRVEHLSERAPVDRLAPSPITAVRMNATSQGNVVLGEGIGQQRQLIGGVARSASAKIT